MRIGLSCARLWLLRTSLFTHRFSEALLVSSLSSFPDYRRQLRTAAVLRSVRVVDSVFDRTLHRLEDDRLHDASRANPTRFLPHGGLISTRLLTVVASASVGAPVLRSGGHRPSLRDYFERCWVAAKSPQHPLFFAASEKYHGRINRSRDAVLASPNRVSMAQRTKLRP